MTTDAGPKLCTVAPAGVTVSAQAKGAGMIEPHLATMLCFVQTDAEVPDADAALRAGVDGSFERITVDGQMSTNDTVVLQASGGAGRPLPPGLLDAVLLQLALDVVADGEGATRVGRIGVTGAADVDEAERMARAIANSPLVQDRASRARPQLGPDRRRRPGSRWPGPSSPSWGPRRSRPSELAADAAEAEIALRLERGDGAASCLLLGPDRGVRRESTRNTRHE